MKVGDRVRIITSIVVYHYPQQKNQPFELKGLEGEIVDIINGWRGRPVSANLPILVQFENKFKAHLHETELEVIE